MASLKRRTFLVGGAAALLAAGGYAWYRFNKSAPIGFEVDEQTLAVGKSFLDKHISVDIHSHPGRSFVEGAENLSGKIKLYAAMGSFEEDTIEKMQKGGITVSSFSTVADFQVIDLGEKGLSSVRDFNEGEAWASYQTQLKTLNSLLEFPHIMQILKPEDIVTAKNSGKIGAFFTTEGADFLEGSLEKLDQVYQDGFRSLTLVHYRINEIGDIHTEPPRHNGLTAFGKSLVKAMNQKGMIIDLAHAAKATSMQAMEVTEKPVMISHSAVRHPNFDSYRFIDPDEAKKLAETGGVIGAWPAGLGLASLSDYIDQIFRLIDDVGIDHVSIGTDMDANYKPVFDDYQNTPVLVGSLLNRGMADTEVAKVIGGNFMRVFREVSA